MTSKVSPRCAAPARFLRAASRGVSQNDSIDRWPALRLADRRRHIDTDSGSAIDASVSVHASCNCGPASVRQLVAYRFSLLKRPATISPIKAPNSPYPIIVPSLSGICFPKTAIAPNEQIAIHKIYLNIVFTYTSLTPIRNYSIVPWIGHNRRVVPVSGPSLDPRMRKFQRDHGEIPVFAVKIPFII